MDRKKHKTARNQFHPAFCAAMELELRENADMLYFDHEHNLNTKPNSIDLLIIKKDVPYVIHSGLGAIFQKYNLMEYKSPTAVLDTRIFHRTLAYAHLYIAYHKEALSLADVSISFIREGFPQDLMSHLSSLGFRIEMAEPGIYHFKKDGQFDIQIIATRLLDPKYKWITKLTNRLKKEDFLEIEKELKSLNTAKDQFNAESVFDLMTKLNNHKTWMKEVKGMGAFRDYFAPTPEERKKERKEMEEKIKKELEHKLKNQLEHKLKNQFEHKLKNELIPQIEKDLKKEYYELFLKQEQENSRLKSEIQLLKNQLQKQTKTAML